MTSKYSNSDTAFVFGSILAVVIFGVVGVITFSVVLNDEAQEKADQIIQEANLFWACMDGCYEMERLVFNVSRFDYNDAIAKGYHDQCSGRCCDLYMNPGRCVGIGG